MSTGRDAARRHTYRPTDIARGGAAEARQPYGLPAADGIVCLAQKMPNAGRGHLDDNEISSSGARCANVTGSHMGARSCQNPSTPAI